MNLPLLRIALYLSPFVLLACKSNKDSGQSDHSECPNCTHAALNIEVVELFNGENLDGWSHHLWSQDGSAQDLPIEDVWSVKDGILVCKGEPLGYLQTTTDYQNYVLNLEWRWPDQPTNSGVLLRIAADPDTFLPKCIEAQLKHGDAGKLYGFYGASLSGDAERYQWIENEVIGDFHAVDHITALEKPAGEWNHYRIEVIGESIRVFINGELANQASGIDLLTGPIGLQSEGSEIHFRNIRLEPM